MSTSARELALTASGERPIPLVGEWIVSGTHWPTYTVVGPVSKTTAQRVYHPSPYGARREAFTTFHELVFSGDEATCIALKERLKSSVALRDQEIAAARVRLQRRQRELVATADAASCAADADRDPGRDQNGL